MLTHLKATNFLLLAIIAATSFPAAAGEDGRAPGRIDRARAEEEGRRKQEEVTRAAQSAKHSDPAARAPKNTSDPQALEAMARQRQQARASERQQAQAVADQKAAAQRQAQTAEQARVAAAERQAAQARAAQDQARARAAADQVAAQQKRMEYKSANQNDVQAQNVPRAKPPSSGGSPAQGKGPG